MQNLQELRAAIRSLHDDSKRKLNQDYELHGALESLFTQVQAVREGLATLSEAFIEESSKHHQRMLRVCLLAQVSARLTAKVLAVAALPESVQSSATIT
jgi:hypothetical protein